MINKLIQYLIETRSSLPGSLWLCESIEYYPALDLYQDRPAIAEYMTLVPDDTNEFNTVGVN
jgi:hypothetical protein